jgi:hypothetical protein
MNKQIKELVKQAGLNIDGFGYPIWGCLDSADEKKEFLEKFTELIIKECENVVASQLERDGEANDEWDRGYISGMWAATRYMATHFGVDTP